MVSYSLVNACGWYVKNESTIGSDHFPVLAIVNTTVCIQEGSTFTRWCFGKADWEKFRICCEESAHLVTLKESIKECTNQVKKVVPWWNEECNRALKERNKAFRDLRKNMSQENLIDYQKKRAVARRIVKYTKKRTWREFCSTIGRGVKLGDVWSMFKQMSGKSKSVKIPALVEGEKLAVSDKEKADVLDRAFATVHSGEHLDDIHRQ